MSAGDDRPATVHVFGSLNIDIARRVERFAQPGETIEGVAIPESPGGKGLNQAVAAARSGAGVEMYGAVGADPRGAQLLAALRSDAIGAAGVTESASATGTAVVLVAETGENLIVIDAGANADAMAPGAEVFAARDILLLQGEVPWEQNRRAIDRATSAGTRVILTPAPVDGIDARDLTGCDVIVANQYEAASLAAGSAEEAAMRLSRDVDVVIVTLGADGALWAVGGEIAGRLPAAPTTVVDTTAAGDTFTGALAARLVEERSVADAIAWALEAAAITVSRAGAVSSIPQRAEVDARTGG